MTTRARVVAGVVGIPLAALAVLGAQAYYASIVDRPDLDPTYDVASLVGADTEAEPLRLVVLGDSTAAGVGAPTLEGALPTLVAERVATSLGRPVAVVGHAVSGARTADLLTTQVPLLADAPADVVVVVIGANDVTKLTAPWTLRRQTTELVAAVRETAPGTPIVLAGIPLFGSADRLPLPLRWVVDAYARPLRTAQAEVARDADGVTYVDIARDASPRFRGVPDAMSADGYHPSPVGYGFWADAIAPAVTAVAAAAE